MELYEQFCVDSVVAGQRLDVYLSNRTGKTRSQIRQGIEQGQVKVNGLLPSKAGYTLKCDDIVEYIPPPPREIEAKPREMPVPILYQDNDVAVIAKPQGMVVHPAAGHDDFTLVNAMLFSLTHLSGIGGALRPGIVHRLDKDTSGLMVIAKNDMAHIALSSQFKDKTVEKVYVALIIGNPKDNKGIINAPIGRHPTERKRMAVYNPLKAPRASVRDAVTEWRVLEQYKGVAYVACRLITGRTHQIRVHMAYIGHPVLDDPVYGRRIYDGQQFLHAQTLSFNHPASGERLTFEALLPERFEKELARLRRMVN